MQQSQEIENLDKFILEEGQQVPKVMKQKTDLERIYMEAPTKTRTFAQSTTNFKENVLGM
jgi:hypothetical protein